MDFGIQKPLTDYYPPELHSNHSLPSKISNYFLLVTQAASLDSAAVTIN